MRPVVVMTGETALPVGCEEPQRIPAFTAPGIRYFASFEDDVIDRLLGETPTGGQAGVSRADDDGRDLLDDDALRSR
jgi:hypothetical protein